jgi:hypothetical protein
MNGDNFVRIVDEGFWPFMRHLGFIMEKPIVGRRLYSVTFTGEGHAVSISYEPDDIQPSVLVFSLVGGRKSSIDDRNATPRLSDLNAIFMKMKSVTKQERAINDAFFNLIVANDSEERLLPKSAKELRLVLPKYITSGRKTGRL